MLSKSTIVKHSGLLFALFLLLVGFVFFRNRGSGYWLLLDDVPTPLQYLSFVPGLYDGIMWHIINRCSHIFGSMLWQKISYLSLFVALGLGGFYLGRKTGILSAIASGIFICCNPFVFDRFVHGQFNVIGGLVLLVRGWVSLLSYIDNKQKISYIAVTGILWGLACSLLYHSIFMVALFGVCMLFVHHTNIKQKIVDFGILVGCVLLPIINVVVGVLNGGSSIVDTALSIENQTSFFRIYDPESPSLAAWRLDGFRRHTYDNFVTSYGYLDYPSIIFFSLFVFVVLGYGYLLYHNKQKLFWISILLVGLLAYILSLAGNGVVFDTIHRFINDNIPRYGGMRDPQKRLIVVLILYTICYARGVVLIQTIHHRLSYFVLSFALALPLLYGNYIFLHDHYFSTTDYPNDRYSAKQYLETIDLCQQTGCYDVLVVPWHLYISFHFTDGVVGNPSDRFFLPAKILQGDNIEIGSIYSHSTRSASKTIESYLGPDGLLPTTDQNIISNFMDALEALGIKHIVLLKETDWQHYDDLLQRTLVGNLGSIVIDDPYIRVYRLK